MLASLANPMALATGDEAGEDIPRPIDFTHNGVDAPAPVTSAQFGSAQSVRPGTAICTTATQSTPNVSTDCEGVNPHNETSIAVNPRNPANMIGGANDYQLSVNPGGHVGETTLSRAHVTFDGGRTWSEYPLLSTSSYQATGDPAVAFEQSGHAYYATLGSGSSVRRMRRTRTSWWPTPATGVAPGRPDDWPTAVASARVSAIFWTRSTSRLGGPAMRS